MAQATLTAGDLWEILEAWDLATPVTELRMATRTQLCAAISMVPRHKNGIGAPFDVIVSDIGPGGIGLIHAEPLQIGAEFAIPPAQSDGARTSLLIRVVHCAESDDGRFRVGARFLNGPSGPSKMSSDLAADPLFRSIFG